MDIGTADTNAQDFGEWIWEQMQVYCHLYLWLSVNHPHLLKRRVR